MITLLLTLACCVQRPDAGERTGADCPGEERPAALVVRGTVELSAGEADAAATALLGERARHVLEEQGRVLMAAAAPMWLPGFCREQVLRRWLGSTDATQMLRVVDRERDTRNHGSLGTSYRTALLVEADQHRLGNHLARLRRQIPRAADTFALKCAGIAGFWAVLALAIGWLDRLSRGYMTWRLRLLGLLAGSAAPTVALFLV